MLQKTSEAAEGFQRFRIDPDPYRFPKAILVDPNSQGYGEMGFNIHADNDHYIQLKSGILRSLSGDFTQSTGDLAFSQTGHFLGVLINRNHAILIPNLDHPFKVALGNGFSSERTSLISNIVDGRIRRLNAELN